MTPSGAVTLAILDLQGRRRGVGREVRGQFPTLVLVDQLTLYQPVGVDCAPPTHTLLWANPVLGSFLRPWSRLLQILG